MESLTNHHQPAHSSGLDRSDPIRAFLLNHETDLRVVLKELCFLPSHPSVELDSIEGLSIVNQAGRWDGYSAVILKDGHGFEYGRIQLTPRTFGGFILRRSFYENNRWTVRHDHFNDSGEYLSSQENRLGDPLLVDLTDMDPGCPITSHLYCLLAFEYSEASEGRSNSRRIAFVEDLLREMRRDLSRYPLSYFAFMGDTYLRVYDARTLAWEHEHVLHWEERRTLRMQALDELNKVLSTKRRIHRTTVFAQFLPKHAMFWRNRAKRLQLRPRSNVAGFIYRYTVGVFLWFIHTVKSNVGYSMALAIYGPFTFFFITQPMNPHAMWAVGKVRGFYLNASQNAQSLLGVSDAPLAPPILEQSSALSVGGSSGALSSAPAPLATTLTLTGSTATTGSSSASSIASFIPDKRNYSQIAPGLGNILLSTQIDEINAQPWSERMSHFKDMQIGYEEGMAYAPRMGRLEQLETQINYPLVTETAWRELERYQTELNAIEKRLSSSGKLSPALTQYLIRERDRASQHELYIWDRTYRFIIDHPYIMMDQTKEQTYTDSYTGRGFVLYQEMTDKLKKRFPELKKPSEAKKIERLADQYLGLRKESSSIDGNLRANSKLFSQGDLTSTREMRGYMQRQWEVLYLLQQRAQEASNFGLQLYTWSVRNAIWTMQAIYSAKRRELALMERAISDPSAKSEIKSEMTRDLNPLLENVFHGMVFEFVGIKLEISERLAKDIESQQRQTVIDNFKGYFQDREAVWKQLGY